MYCISESSHIIIEYGVFFTFTLDRTQITAQFLKRAMKFLQQTSVWSCFFTRAVSSVSVVFRVCLSDLSDRFEGFDKLSKEWHSLGGGKKNKIERPSMELFFEPRCTYAAAYPFIAIQ